METKPIFITDFDGTVSEEDFFWTVVDAYLTKNALAPWQDYLDHKISHIDALNAIFGKLRISQAEMDAFIENFKIDPAFYKTMQLCKKLAIPVYMVSAGSAYYIRKKIGPHLEEFNITLVANEGVFSPSAGLKLIPPAKNSAFYGENAGVSKVRVIEKLKEEGRFCVFAGDGPPDFEAAKFADVIFAKKLLLKMCKEAGIKTEKFDSYEDIYSYLNKKYGNK